MPADQAVTDPAPVARRPSVLPEASLHKLPAAIFLLHETEEGRWTFPFASEALQRIFMMPASALAADAGVVSSSIPPADLAQLKRQLAQALEFGQPCRTRIRIQPPGVDQAWYEVTAAPEILAGGGTLWHGLLVDVSHNQRAQAQLRTQHQRWRQAVHAADLGFIEFDPVTGRMRLDALACRHHGIEGEPAWLLLPNWLDTLAPEDRLVAHAALTSATVAGARERLVLRVNAADGQLRTIEILLHVIEEEQRLIGTCRDLTQAAQREARQTHALAAERVHRSQREFLSRISHELRTPLNGVLGFAQLMAQDRNSPPTPQQHQRLEIIQQSAHRLMSLIDQLLDLASLEEGRTLLKHEALELAGPIQACLARLRPLAAQQRVALVTEAVPETAIVWADYDALTRVLESVMSNAIQYNRPGGRVQLHLEVRQGQTVLAVEDTGRGMSAEQLSQLFDPFNRLGAHGHDVRGTGLGLVIARQLMRAMNGDILVQSKPGVGTRVELLIPSTDSAGSAEADAAQGTHVPPPPPAAERAEAQKLILYIEDDEVNTLLMEQVLRNQPAWRMVAAATGGAGLEMARDRHPSVILLDLHLPDMPGIEVLKQLREDPRTRHIPCIAVSADAHWEHLATTTDIGFDAFWKKPIDFEQVLGGLRALLSGPAA